MGVTINKKSTTTEPPPQNGQQAMPPGRGGDLNTLYLDSAVVEVQEMFSSDGDFLTNAINRFGV